jgi:hypothetical protein
MRLTWLASQLPVGKWEGECPTTRCETIWSIVRSDVRAWPASEDSTLKYGQLFLLSFGLSRSADGSSCHRMAKNKVQSVKRRSPVCMIQNLKIRVNSGLFSQMQGGKFVVSGRSGLRFLDAQEVEDAAA